METSEKTYVSLDIETSGFDPEKNEILEVGFVKFGVGKSGLEILEEWTKVFRPRQPVSAHVLGLTGISQEELDNGAEFAEFREYLQKQLGAATIVGHNVIFDVRFLEKNGLVFSGDVIDTMDLVQIFLPTHHSYNLENLMYYFEVPHTDAHRALADSQAVVKLLESISGCYQRLPQETKEVLGKLAENFAFPWLDLLQQAPVSSIRISSAANEPIALAEQDSGRHVLSDRMIYAAPAFEDPLNIAARLIAETRQRLLIVVPKRHQVLQLWKRGMARGIFGPRHRFNAVAFQALLAQPNLSAEEARFAMKATVWRATNWQAEYTIDLNLSFSGGQFKELVSGSPLPETLAERVACCDQETYLELSGHPLLQGRTVAILGLGDFERAVTSTLGQRSSWGYLSYLLRSVYNPELGTGAVAAKDTVVQTLADADLFFGLASGLLGKANGGKGDITLDESVRNSHEFTQITLAAGNFLEKLRQAQSALHSAAIAEFIETLSQFFTEQPGFVKWVHVDDLKCVFNSLPLDISGIVRGHLAGAAKVCFVENCGQQLVVDYFARRLGLAQFVGQPLPWQPRRGLRDWWQGLTGQQAFCQIITRNADDAELEGLLQKPAMPAALVMDTAQTVSEFYKSHYHELRQRAFLLVQQADGGSNKLFHNFAIRPGSLLLVTDKGVLRFLRNLQQVRPIDRVKLKTLILTGLPSISLTDPYSKALAAQFKDPAQEYVLPCSLFDFYCLLQFFHSPNLRQVYVYLPKKSHIYKDIYIQLLSSYFKTQVQN